MKTQIRNKHYRQSKENGQFESEFLKQYPTLEPRRSLYYENPNANHYVIASEASLFDALEPRQDTVKGPFTLRTREKDDMKENVDKNQMKFSFNAQNFEEEISNIKPLKSSPYRFKNIYEQEYERQCKKIKSNRQIILKQFDKTKQKQKYEQKERNLGSPIKKINQSSELEKQLDEIINIRPKQSKQILKVQQQFNKSKSLTLNKQQSQLTQYLTAIFDDLDQRKTGLLTYDNCNYKRIKQELKIIFGSIFCKIIFHKLSLNKNQFIKLSLESIKQIGSQQVFSIFISENHAKDNYPSQKHESKYKTTRKLQQDKQNLKIDEKINQKHFYSVKDQQKSHFSNINFKNFDTKNPFNYIQIKELSKTEQMLLMRKRNISQSMILQQKRKLNQIIQLDNLVIGYLKQSKKQGSSAFDSILTRTASIQKY